MNLPKGDPLVTSESRGFYRVTVTRQPALPEVLQVLGLHRRSSSGWGG